MTPAMKSKWLSKELELKNMLSNLSFKLFLGLVKILSLWSVLCCIQMIEIGASTVGQPSGPRFLDDWPPFYAYSNRAGGLLRCTTSGYPKPKVEWVADLFPVKNISTLREVDETGILRFGPFNKESYRSDIHSTKYHCVASNSIGSIRSQPILTQAILDSQYRIETNDISVLEGNCAILRCKVPDQLKGVIIITSWIIDAKTIIYPNFHSGLAANKHMMLPGGDLFIKTIKAEDSYKTFTCKTSNKLTNEAKTSQPVRIYLKGTNSFQHLKLILPERDDITLKPNFGEDIYLPCLAQGNPPPTYRWYRERDGILSDLLEDEMGDLFHLGPILLRQVRPEHSGTYVCRVNNSISHQVARIIVQVYVPLKVQLTPRSVIVDVRRSITFRCITQGSPVLSISWLKNGKKIHGSSLFQGPKQDEHASRKYVISSKGTMSIESVDPDDAGMYQCFAHNDKMTVQDSAELILGSTLPKLVYRFSEQTIKPGPSISLKCIGVGNPPPQFKWSLDKFLLPENDRLLVGQYVTIHDKVISHVNITNVGKEDGGLYTCQAFNAMGSISHSARLNVYGPPVVRSVPTVKAVAGKRLHLLCPVSGYPIETIVWSSGGNKLPVTRMQKVYQNGTLIIDHVSKSTDEGVYQCTATNKQGSSSSADIRIDVIVPPKIMPFEFMNNLLQEGMRGAVSCQVLQGDTPIEFGWQFNSVPISSSSSPKGVNIRIPDEFSSTLIVESLSSSHNGMYTCTAENSAGRDSHSAQLTVSVPPKWTVEPEDLNASADDSVSLHCQAEGYPKPAIVWKRATGQEPGEYLDLDRKRTRIFSNGTIYFHGLEKQDEGKYLCEARNGVGAGLSKVIFVKVNAPAQFLERDQQIFVRAGEKAVLQCLAKGDPRIDVQWSNAHSKITSRSNHRYKIHRKNVEDGLLSELVISNSDRSDTGVYSCHASNHFGADYTSVTLTVQEPPEQPKNLRLSEPLSRSVKISWMENFDGNSPLINFIIQYKSPAGTWTEEGVEEISMPATQNTALVKSLSPFTEYEMRVLAENSVGLSSPSEPIKVTTLEEPPEGTPSEIKIVAVSSTKLKITWSPPDEALWHGTILGYYLGFREIGLALENEMSVGESNIFSSISSSQRYKGKDIGGYHFTTVDVLKDMGGEMVLENLNKFTTYAIVIQTFNAKGTGPTSTPILATTLQDVPSHPPMGVQCQGRSSEALFLQWQDPPIQERNGVIEGYRVTYQVYDEKEFPFTASENKLIEGREATINGLKKWTNYSIVVTAFTSAGNGKASKAIICQTDEDVPSSPADIKAMMSSATSILISWLPPKLPNGNIVKYMLYVARLSPDVSRIQEISLDAHEQFYELRIERREASDDADATNHPYEFWLSAFTHVGEGAMTRRVRVIISSKVAAKIASFGGDVETPWKNELFLACRTVGIPQPAIYWTYDGVKIESSHRIGIRSDGTLKIGSVGKENGGNYTCFASNLHGKDFILYSLKVLSPPPAPKLVVKESSFEALRIHWSALESGGSAVRGFRLNYRKFGGEWEEKELNPKTNNHVLRGLKCGSHYEIYITAFNKIGIGDPSDVVTGTTKGSVPEKMTKEENPIQGNSSAIMVHLNNWKNMGCPIIHYLLEYKSSGGTKWNRIADKVDGHSKFYVISGLKHGTKYDVRVIAENHAGTTSIVYTFTTAESTDNSPQSDYSTNSESKNSILYTSLLIVLPSVLALLAVLSVIAFVFYVRHKRMGTGATKAVIGESSGAGFRSFIDTDAEENDDRYYEPNVLREHHQQLQRQRQSQEYYSGTKTPKNKKVAESMHNKSIESTVYGDDICPYATFQLPDNPPTRPLLTKGSNRAHGGAENYLPTFEDPDLNNSLTFHHHTGDTLYNVGNIYAGPYHAVQSGALLSYNQTPTLQLRDVAEFSHQLRRSNMEDERQHHLEHEYLGNTNYQTRSILPMKVQAPVPEMEAVGSDSDGESKNHIHGRHRSHWPNYMSIESGKANSIESGYCDPTGAHMDMATAVSGASSGTTISQSHELARLKNRQRSGDAVLMSDHTTSSSDSYSPSVSNEGSVSRCAGIFSHQSTNRKNKGRTNGRMSGAGRGRSSSGYSSHTEETSFR